MLPLRLLAIFYPLVVSLATDTTRGQPKPRPSNLTDQPACHCCNCTPNQNETVVDCTSRHILDIPHDLPHNTVKLELQGNKIKTIEKNAFVNLSNLRYLDLTNNTLRDINDNAFTGLRKLHTLKLGHNERIALNAKILAPLKGLMTLKLWKTKNISITSDAFLNTTSLMCLNVGHCNLQNISFLRSLRNSHKLDHIYLHRNNLGNLTKDIFEGLTIGPKGLFLSLNNSKIRHIENGTFSPIKGLTYLDLSNNSIASSFPGALYGLINLQQLRLSSVGFNNSGIFIKMWEQLQPNTTVSASLTKLYLVGNQLKKIQDNSFIGLGNLEVLNLSRNPFPERISKSGFCGLDNLRKLYLQGCSELTTFPTFVSENDTSFTPKLANLSLSGSPVVTLQKIDVFRGLESLKTLDLSQTFVRGLKLDLLKNLETLRLRYSCLDELPYINSSVLKRLEIANNQFYITKELHGNWTIPNLEVLDIHGNKFDNMISQDTANFLSMFPNLKTLQMGKMGLFFLEGWIFDNLTKLEKLELSFNALGNINAHWFENLKHLETLEMRDCRIATVNEKSFPSEEFLNQVTHLDLRNNPFSCDCSMKWFLNWTKYQNNQLFNYKYNKKDYTCASPLRWHGWPINQFTIPQSCYMAYTLLTGLSAAGVAVLVCFFIGLALLSRYRWHIKYKLFKLKIWYYGSQYEEVDGSKYEYDYHVHYDDDDVTWVVNTLIPELETKRGYRLYIKHRDSPLCAYIIENIRYSIEHSYKTVLCLSNKFTRNPGTQFLLSFIINKLVNEKKNILVCILLEEIEGENLLDTLEEVLTEKNYIRLPEDRTEEAMEYFWTLVDEALHLPVIPYRNVSLQNAPDMPEERVALLKNVC